MAIGVKSFGDVMYDPWFFFSRGDDYFDALNPKNIRNPYLQRLYHSLQHRALNPDKPLPPLDERLLSQLTMPKELALASAAEVDRIKLLFPLKKVEKPKFRRQQTGAAADQQYVHEEWIQSILTEY